MRPNNFSVIDAPQRSDAWFAARAGRVTGSCASKILMGEKTAGRNDYILQLAIERLTGVVDMNGFISADMQRGIDKEPLARIAVEAERGVFIRETGFCLHHKLMIGTSLDGDIEDFDCLVEFKCPKSTTHIGYIETNELPKEYRAQVMHALYVTGSQHNLFCSYDDRMPTGLDLFIVETDAKDLPIDEYEISLLKFLKEVENMEDKLRNLRKAA